MGKKSRTLLSGMANSYILTTLYFLFMFTLSPLTKLREKLIALDLARERIVVEEDVPVIGAIEILPRLYGLAQWECCLVWSH